MSRAEEIAAALRILAPALPARDAAAVLDRALGSRGLRKARPQSAAWLALVAYVRHGFTEYDALLADGYAPDAARHFTLAATEEILAAWGCRHPVTSG